MGFLLRKAGFVLLIVVCMVVPWTMGTTSILAWWVLRGLTADERLKDGNEVGV